MSYVRRVLQPEEQVLYQSTLHWIVFIPAILLLLIGLAGLGLYLVATDETLPILAYSLMAVGFAAGGLSLLSAWFRRWTTEVAVTDRRIIFKQGFISRHTVEMNMDKVESVDVDQTILGRMLDYGDITVRGTGSSIEPLRRIDAPLAFRNAVTAR